MIKAKLKSSRGATLIFALVAMAVAVIVCAVVIYAAQSNAGRIRSAQAAEQYQLTLNSAASAVRREFANDGITLVRTYTTVTTNKNGTKTETVNPGAVNVVYQKTKETGTTENLYTGTYTQSGGLTPTANLTPLRRALLDWTLDIMEGSVRNTNDCLGQYTIKASGPDGAMQDVHLEIRLEPGGTADLPTQDSREEHDAEKYYLTAKLRLEDTSASAEVITMTFMATVNQSKSSTLVSKTSTTEPGTNGGTISISTTTVETKETLKMVWADGNVVVNVADKTGGFL